MQVIKQLLSSGETQYIYVLEQPLLANNASLESCELDCQAISTSLERSPSLVDQALLKSDRAIYAEYIQIPQWHEVLWASQVPAAQFNPHALELKRTTSYLAQAKRAGQQLDLYPIGVLGLVFSSCGALLFGRRTGRSKAGQLCSLPAGHCSPYQHGQSPLFAGFFEELATELGVKASQTSRVRILGWQSDPAWGRGITVVIEAHLKQSFGQLSMAHNQSLQLFEQLRKDGVGHNQRLLQLSAAGLLNIDAHESDLLVGIPITALDLEHSIKTQQLEYRLGGQQQFLMLDITRGALLLWQASLQRLGALDHPVSQYP